MGADGLDVVLGVHAWMPLALLTLPDMGTMAAIAGIVGALAAVVALPLMWLSSDRFGRRKKPPRDSVARIDLGPADAVTPARRELLEEVRRQWVETELNSSLQRLARIELGLAARPGAVAHPLRAILRRPAEADEQLPRGVRIADVFRRLGRQLLILGEPGSGKTTLLLELAADLLDEAAGSATGTMPVVFHLSTWTDGKGGLSAWLVDELNQRYGVARRLAAGWVEAEQVVPLLDGLDEVAQERRGACLVAINQFHAAHGQLPLVVVSRATEYEALQAKLALRGAVIVQPLSRDQVDEYLAEAGGPLAAIRSALRHDESLYELLTTPLFLSIAALTYQGRPAAAARGAGGIEERRELLLRDYVAAMLDRPVESAIRFPDDRMRAWLGWLARGMRDRGQSVFYPDLIQPDWLPTAAQRWASTAGIAAGAGLVCAVLGGLLVGIGQDPVSGLTLGLGCGLGVALCAYESGIAPAEQLRWSWAALRRDLPRWLVFFGLVFGLGGGLGFGIAGAVSMELSSLFRAVHAGLAGGLVDALSYAIAALGAGVGVGAGIGILGGLSSGLETRFSITPPSVGAGIRRSARTALVSGALSGLASALFVGIAEGAFGNLYAQGLGPVLSRINPSIVSPLYVGLVFGLGGGLVAALTIRSVPRLGAGVVRGLCAAVIGGLLLGLIPVWDQTGFLAGLGSPDLGGLAPRLVLALGFGLVVGVGGGVDGAPAARVMTGLGGAVIVALVGGLVSANQETIIPFSILVLAQGITSTSIVVSAAAVGMAVGLAVGLQRGGGAYLRHYALRAVLARDGFAPPDLVGFLDYGARLVLLMRRGGGYQFVHRFLLEHLAGGPGRPKLRTAATRASALWTGDAPVAASLAVGVLGVGLALTAVAMLVTGSASGPLDPNSVALLTADALYLPFGLIGACAAAWSLWGRRPNGRGRALPRAGLVTTVASLAVLATFVAGILATLAAVRPPMHAVGVSVATGNGNGLGGIVRGGDGSIWFAEGNVNRIGRLTAGGTITEFVLPGTDSQPLDVTSGPGGIWFTEFGRDRIGRITTSGVITEVPLLHAGTQPAGIATGPDGTIWFTEAGGNRIGRIRPAGGIVETALPTQSGAGFITVSQDGDAWFTEDGRNRIGRITPTGDVSEFTIGAMLGASGITAAPDGSVWFTERDDNRVGRITPQGAVTEYPLPHAGSDPFAVVAGAGGSVWFTESSGDRIGRVTPGGELIELSLPHASSDPTFASAGTSGDLWFTEDSADRIGHVTGGGAIDEHVVSADGRAAVGVVAGRNGDVWFSDATASRIGRVSPAGAVVELALPHRSSYPWGMAFGADGSLWFTEFDGNRIGRLAPDGNLSELTLPGRNNEPSGIVAAPDGGLWFTEFSSGRIGRINPPGALAEFDLPDPASGPLWIAAAPDGRLWFTEYVRGRIGVISPAGAITEFALRDPASEPAGIVAGADGGVWFTEQGVNRIGHITRGGAIDEFLVSTVFGVASGGLDTFLDVQPWRAAAGPDGSIWFTERDVNRIGRITPAGAVVQFEVSQVPEDLTFASDGSLWFTTNSGQLSHVEPDALHAA